jgi:hypothetical protein
MFFSFSFFIATQIDNSFLRIRPFCGRGAHRFSQVVDKRYRGYGLQRCDIPDGTEAFLNQRSHITHGFVLQGGSVSYKTQNTLVATRKLH